jgi:hypothetical protein
MKWRNKGVFLPVVPAAQVVYGAPPRQLTLSGHWNTAAGASCWPADEMKRSACSTCCPSLSRACLGKSPSFFVRLRKCHLSRRTRRTRRTRRRRIVFSYREVADRPHAVPSLPSASSGRALGSRDSSGKQSRPPRLLLRLHHHLLFLLQQSCGRRPQRAHAAAG